MKPKIKYDPEGGALYITLSKEKIVQSLAQRDHRIIVDYDENNDIVGIEILDFKSKENTIIK